MGKPESENTQSSILSRLRTCPASAVPTKLVRSSGSFLQLVFVRVFASRTSCAPNPQSCLPEVIGIDNFDRFVTMNRHQWIPPLVLTLFLLIGYLPEDGSCCNEAVCGSVVSKCLLTKSCNCDFNFDNCTCCKDCLNCLGYLYNECCSCVEMCPMPNSTSSPLSKKSHVEDLQETAPALFNALTEAPDTFNRWNSTTFPIDIDISQYGSKKEVKLLMQQNNPEQQVIPEKPNPNIYTVNCTVAFWSQCMSWTKCKSSCQSMGASSYRWFHDGCCQCVGEKCINYGINESRCGSCPASDEKDDEIPDDEMDYGENEEDDDELAD